MSNEPKLPTESKWLKILGGSGIGRPIIDELRERGLIASEPVDPVNEAVAAIALNRGVLGASTLHNIRADDYRRDLSEAVSRGMEIEREKRPVPTRTAIAEAIYAVMKSRDIEEISRWQFGPIGQTHDANAIIDALQEQLK